MQEELIPCSMLYGIMNLNLEALFCLCMCPIIKLTPFLLPIQDHLVLNKK